MKQSLIVKAVFTSQTQYPTELERKLPKQAFAALACIAYINTPISEIEVFAAECHRDRRVIGGYQLRLQLDGLPEAIHSRLVELRNSRNLSAFVSFAYASMCLHIEGLSGEARSAYLAKLVADREELYLAAKAATVWQPQPAPQQPFPQPTYHNHQFPTAPVPQQPYPQYGAWQTGDKNNYSK